MRIIRIKIRWLIISIIIVGLLSISLLLFKGNKDEVTTTMSIANKVIVIDPGHGGVDPGAISNSGVKEKNINLLIAKKLKRLLEQSGTIVILTREEDVGLYTEKSTTYRQKKNEDLRNRRIMANEINPDIFITIHLNSFPQSRYYGAQTFFQQGSEEGKKLAVLIQEELKNVLDEDNGRVPQSRDTIYLLREVKALAVLIECGFLSNPEESSLLNNPVYQEKIAWSIYTGIIRYLNEEKL
ncbi:N-acetylmuramoyl-L-alanine amidase CwlD [Sporosalibacterium faouarense]|uniref:N-acetylmuramoyl-L-alanine amidase CwlD n=1 Tax=Sporosalibacterium faouarense TaxID=516123 RepID=UPI00141CB8FB|nr:N-acetylmuramoyl-L-alanine amidase CwlD [Sporosalibacterium faouarense]MTI48297.1 N-acetylmuramoyl-L-alanine amidase CwlD [Bacillota bacterium]